MTAEAEPFRFGAPQARDDMGGCCGKWAGCWIESKGCVNKPKKAEWQAGIVQEPEGRIMGVEHGPWSTLGGQP